MATFLAPKCTALHLRALKMHFVSNVSLPTLSAFRLSGSFMPCTDLINHNAVSASEPSLLPALVLVPWLQNPTRNIWAKDCSSFGKHSARIPHCRLLFKISRFIYNPFKAHLIHTSYCQFLYWNPRHYFIKCPVNEILSTNWGNNLK